ncbi:MAG: hypothetical protein EOM91_11030 [Sphingobacteriia bacterium]|nr:hypothetical protein [Sphingobacteriia bacterium]NCC39495.1 hypothetical protein [Gammaproteobacteria bacterium]
MLENESGYGEDINERVPPLTSPDARGPSANLLVRRRIEHMRELKRLRELLDDPDFEDLS